MKTVSTKSFVILSKDAMFLITLCQTPSENQLFQQQENIYMYTVYSQFKVKLKCIILCQESKKEISVLVMFFFYFSVMVGSTIGLVVTTVPGLSLSSFHTYMGFCGYSDFLSESKESHRSECEQVWLSICGLDGLETSSGCTLVWLGYKTPADPRYLEVSRYR